VTQAWLKKRGERQLNLARYLGLLEQRRTTPNGVFGSKVHFEHWLKQFGDKSKAGVEYLKSQDRLILITRRDKLAQAVSYARANQTRIWGRSLGDAPVEKTEWSDAFLLEISRSLARAIAQDDSWRVYLAEHKLPYLEVCYENFLADYAGEFARVLEYLDIDRRLAFSVKPATAKIGQDNDATIERFLSSIGVAHRP
jgi:LPS sulfotransferase NodH